MVSAHELCPLFVLATGELSRFQQQFGEKKKSSTTAVATDRPTDRPGRVTGVVEAGALCRSGDRNGKPRWGQCERGKPGRLLTGSVDSSHPR